MQTKQTLNISLNGECEINTWKYSKIESTKKYGSRLSADLLKRDVTICLSHWLLIKSVYSAVLTVMQAGFYGCCSRHFHAIIAQFTR